MSERTVAVLRGAVVAWGALILAIVVSAILLGAYHSGRTRTDAAKRDAQFVLSRCELGEDRIERVVHAYATPRSFPGSHLEAYAIRISRVDVSELAAAPGSTLRSWYRGDQLPPLVRGALESMRRDVGRDPIAWFPKVEDLGSAGVYVYPWSVATEGVSPSEVDLIFVRPADKMVFYYERKT